MTMLSLHPVSLHQRMPLRQQPAASQASHLQQHFGRHTELVGVKSPDHSILSASMVNDLMTGEEQSVVRVLELWDTREKKSEIGENNAIAAIAQKKGAYDIQVDLFDAKVKHSPFLDRLKLPRVADGDKGHKLGQLTFHTQAAGGKPPRLADINVSLMPTKGPFALTASGPALGNNWLHLYSTQKPLALKNTQGKAVWTVDELRPKEAVHLQAAQIENPVSLDPRRQSESAAKEPFIAVIPAGGQATRLEPLTDKPAFELADGMSNIQRLVLGMAYAGASQVLITPPHDKKALYEEQIAKVQAYLKEHANEPSAKTVRKEFKVTLHPVKNLVGDADAAYLAAKAAGPNNKQPIFNVYGDSVISLKFGELVNTFNDTQKKQNAKEGNAVVVGEELPNEQVVKRFGLMVTNPLEAAINKLGFKPIKAFAEKPASLAELVKSVQTALDITESKVPSKSSGNSGIVLMDATMGKSLVTFAEKTGYKTDAHGELDSAKKANICDFLEAKTGKPESNVFAYNLHRDAANQDERWIDAGILPDMLRAMNMIKEKGKNLSKALPGVWFPAQMPEANRAKVAKAVGLEQNAGLNGMVVAPREGFQLHGELPQPVVPFQRSKLMQTG